MAHFNAYSSYLINDGLHVGLVGLIPIEKRGPLVRGNTQASLHGNLDDLGVMFSPQSLIGPELFL